MPSHSGPTPSEEKTSRRNHAVSNSVFTTSKYKDHCVSKSVWTSKHVDNRFISLKKHSCNAVNHLTYYLNSILHLIHYTQRPMWFFQVELKWELWLTLLLNHREVPGHRRWEISVGRNPTRSLSSSTQRALTCPHLSEHKRTNSVHKYTNHILKLLIITYPEINW